MTESSDDTDRAESLASLVREVTPELTEELIRSLPLALEFGANPSIAGVYKGMGGVSTGKQIRIEVSIDTDYQGEEDDDDDGYLYEE